jgi:hypothetical protein
MSAFEQDPWLSVLFVDDELLVLAALRRNLRTMADRWEMCLPPAVTRRLGCWRSALTT